MWTRRLVLPFALAAASAFPSDITFTYDANGNLKTKTADGLTTEYFYDTRNLLTEVRQSDLILVRYQYDQLGRVNLKIGEQGVRQYVYDGDSDRVLVEYDVAGLEVARYSWARDRLLEVVRAGQVLRPVFDALGSVVALTDEAGTPVAVYHYDVWGQYRFPEELDTDPNRHGFTGHRWEREVGLVNANARRYDPTIGRFTTQDSYLGELENPASQHRYLYAHGNPTTYVDRTGHLVQLPSDPKQREEVIALLKLGVPKAAWGNVQPIAGTGKGGLREGEYYVDPAPFQGLKTDDRNLSRLKAVVISEKRSLVNTVTEGTKPTGIDPKTGKAQEYPYGLSSPEGVLALTMPRPDDPGAATQPLISPQKDTSQIHVVGHPVGTAVTTLAHELYTHEYIAQQGKPSSHTTMGGPIDQDAAESQREALKNLMASGVVTKQDLAAATNARNAHVEAFLRSLPPANRAGVEEEIRKSYEGREADWLDFDPVQRTRPMPPPTPGSSPTPAAQRPRR